MLCSIVIVHAGNNHEYKLQWLQVIGITTALQGVSEELIENMVLITTAWIPDHQLNAIYRVVYYYVVYVFPCFSNRVAALKYRSFMAYHSVGYDRTCHGKSA